MAYQNNITTSLRGRRLGLQLMSTVETGGSRGPFEHLVGPESFRMNATTADTTGTNLHPWGVSYLASGTSSVYTIDPPIPGVMKVIISSTSGPAYVKTANSETFVGVTTVGSSNTTVKISSIGNSLLLVGATTAVWAVLTGVHRTTSGGDSFTWSTST